MKHKQYIAPIEDPIKVPKFEEAAGFYTTKQRSQMMSKIRGSNTAPEKRIKQALWAAGIRYKKASKKLAGKPDLQLLKYKIVIFIDGDFWHGYDWENKKSQIKANRGFWIPKIERNIQRDRHVTAKLRAQGYTVLRFWEHQVKYEFGMCILHILTEINSRKDPMFTLETQAPFA